MRKNALIEYLNTLPGNPEIAIWNSIVGDYQIVGEATTLEIVKESREFVWRCLEGEALRDQTPMPTLADLKEAMRYRKWDLPNSFVKPEDYPKWYGNNRRTLVVLDPKSRGEETWDRMGTMEY